MNLTIDWFGRGKLELGRLVKWQVLGLRIARSRVQVRPGSVLVRPTQPSTLKREENEYVLSGAEYEIYCLDNCEVPCYGHARWHSGALLGSSRPGSPWLPDKGNSSYLQAYFFRFFSLLLQYQYKYLRCKMILNCFKVVKHERQVFWILGYLNTLATLETISKSIHLSFFGMLGGLRSCSGWSSPDNLVRWPTSAVGTF